MRQSRFLFVENIGFAANYLDEKLPWAGQETGASDPADRFRRRSLLRRRLCRTD
jgi:hypothetical protein